MSVKLSLGYSPCPNDTFIFDALVNGGMDTGGYTFNPVLDDVETLNQWAFEGKLDITKLSFATYFLVKDQYRLLRSGAALGKGVGPLLVGREKMDTSRISQYKIAIPGEHTTANLLLGYVYPEAKNKIVRLFSEIEDVVLSGEADLGVLIHENRFTYAQRGLCKITDLGEVWEERTGVPIPLGGIFIKKSLGEETAEKIESLVRTSVELAFKKLPTISEYIRCHAQAMDESVMRQHIDLYVNEFSIDLGDEGLKAVDTLRKQSIINNY